MVVSYFAWPSPDEKLGDGVDVAELPTFIAVKIAECDADPHPFARLWSTCDVAESLLRICVVLGAADIEAAHGELSRELAREFLQIRRPTFDHWLRMACAVAKAVGDTGLVPELRRAVPDVLEPMVRGKDGVMDLRNNLAHGGRPDHNAAKYLVGHYVRRVRDALTELPWLRELEFVAQDGAEEVVLRGDARLAGFRPAPGNTTNRVLVRRGNLARIVWPVCSWLVPDGEQEAVPSIYVRCTTDKLEHLPLRNAFQFARMKGEAVRRFEELFRLNDKDPHGSRLQDFDDDLKNQGPIHGREVEKRSLLELIRTLPRPHVIWLAGSPGVGKSALLSKVGKALEGAGEDQVLLWRFQYGDPRCTTTHFLRYALRELALRKLVWVKNAKVELTRRRAAVRAAARQQRGPGGGAPGLGWLRREVLA